MPPRKTAAAAINENETEQPGDGGTREEAVLAGTEAIETGADQLDFPEAGKIVEDLALHNLEQFKNRPKPWDQLSQSEQRDLYAALSANAKETVRRVVEAIARDGREPIRALLESYTEKDGIKVTLKVKTYSDEESLAAVVGLHKSQGKNVLITVASADDYDQAKTVDPSQEDQPALGFEAGTDDHPDDDSDLAGDAPDEFTGVRDGDSTTFAGETGHVRIDLKKGWVQFMADSDEDDTWQDMREASAAELAAERERVQDFVE
jgi:hypothetical protein